MKRGQFEAFYPNGMRRRFDTAAEALRFVSHQYLLPAVVASAVRESDILKLFRKPTRPVEDTFHFPVRAPRVDPTEPRDTVELRFERRIVRITDVER